MYYYVSQTATARWSTGHTDSKDKSQDINQWLKTSSSNWREQETVNWLDWRLYLCLVSSQCHKLFAQSFSCQLQLSTQPDSYNTVQSSTTSTTTNVEQLITNHHDRFRNRYRCEGNYVCQALISATEVFWHSGALQIGLLLLLLLCSLSLFICFLVLLFICIY